MPSDGSKRPENVAPVAFHPPSDGSRRMSATARPVTLPAVWRTPVRASSGATASIAALPRDLNPRPVFSEMYSSMSRPMPMAPDLRIRSSSLFW